MTLRPFYAHSGTCSKPEPDAGAGGARTTAGLSVLLPGDTLRERECLCEKGEACPFTAPHLSQDS